MCTDFVRSYLGDVEILHELCYCPRNNIYSGEHSTLRQVPGTLHSMSIYVDIPMSSFI